MSNVQVELLRGRHFPQTEDDPNPCTTQLRVSIYSENYADVLAPEECSSVQERSNDPFYKDVVTLHMPDTFVGDAVLFIKVVEYTRQSAPFVLLTGEVPISTLSGKSKKEVVVPLTYANPIDDPEAAAAERAVFTEGGPAADRFPVVSLKFNVVQRKTEVAHDPDADVVVTRELAFDGSVQVVPASSQYAWLRLTGDKKWADAFGRSVVSAWKSRAPLEQPAETKKVKRTRSKGDTGTTAAAQREIRSVGETVEKKWCCRRLHQVLTRLCMTAEKYAQGDTVLGLTSDEERAFRTCKKERTMLLEDMCQVALTKSSNAIKDTVDRLWTIFNTGIDLDPSGSKTLSYDVRKRVYDATFEDADGVVLEACLLYFLIPTLPFEKCQLIAEEDFKKAPLRPVVTGTNFEGSLSKVTESERKFTQVLIDFLGPLMDTLTAAELSKIAKAFKPAVSDAYKRIAKGGKEGISQRLTQNAASVPKVFGDGIPIDHLDKYGRRKKAVQFA